jgi:hypothetical protein
MIDPLTGARPAAKRRVLTAICICGILLVGATAFVPASQAAPEAEFTYQGDAVIHHAGEVYLWSSEPVRIQATVSGVENGDSVCLHRRVAYGNDTQQAYDNDTQRASGNDTHRIKCTQLHYQSTTETVSVQFDLDQWPDSEPGRYAVDLTVRPPGNDSEVRRVASGEVIVMKKSGDIDVDGLTNIAERRGETNFTDPDTDNDGLLDGHEVTQYDTSPVDPDTDGDGIRDGVEIMFGTDPSTDGTNGTQFGDVMGNRSGTTDREPDDGSADNGSVDDDRPAGGVIQVYFGRGDGAGVRLTGVDLFALPAGGPLGRCSARSGGARFVRRPVPVDGRGHRAGGVHTDDRGGARPRAPAGARGDDETVVDRRRDRLAEIEGQPDPVPTRRQRPDPEGSERATERDRT